MRVPVRVVENDDVSGAEVDAQAAGTRRQHEDKLGVGRVRQSRSATQHIHVHPGILIAGVVGVGTLRTAAENDYFERRIC